VTTTKDITPMNNRTIIQIIPAAGFRAVYRPEDAPDQLIERPLACWALVEDHEGSRSVEGMDVDWAVDFCGDTGGFVGYAAPGELPADRLHGG
jgi:hypothetical protein